MTREEAMKVSGRSESWLLKHTCVLCGQDLYSALRFGCTAIHEKCDPAKKDFTDAGRAALQEER